MMAPGPSDTRSDESGTGNHCIMKSLQHYLLSVDDDDAMRRQAVQFLSAKGIDALVDGLRVTGDRFDARMVHATQSPDISGIGMLAVIVAGPDAHGVLARHPLPSGESHMHHWQMLHCCSGGTISRYFFTIHS